MCVLCALILSLDLFFLQSSDLQKPSLPIVGNACSQRRVGHVVAKCVVVCLENETCTVAAITESPQNQAIRR